MNLSSAAVAPGVDEFALAGLGQAASRFVKPPRVAESPAAFECRLWKVLPMPSPRPGAEPAYTVVFGEVVGIYIDDAFVDENGTVQSAAMQPLARLGYMAYSVVRADAVFTMNRPVPAAGWAVGDDPRGVGRRVPLTAARSRRLCSRRDRCRAGPT